MGKLGVWVDYDQKIVCSELRRQNLISFEDWIIDASHCAQTFSPITYLGYRLWANPCSRLMLRYPSLARSLARVVRWMAADLKYRKGVSHHRHWRGWLIRCCVFWPGNWLLGSGVFLSLSVARRWSGKSGSPVFSRQRPRISSTTFYLGSKP
ncbi:hypothetical protein [Bordetella petrii]|uniref:hypothetical protein n=1 Tax=Bordetella petrii TaxID=94624 RepID=UPI0038B34614